MAIKDNVLSLLGLSQAENKQIDTIISVVSSRLCAKLTALTGSTVDAVPEALESVTTEVCVARYNRIGSEGTSSHSVDGETMSWSDDDFAPYEDEIEAYADSVRKASAGRLRFL